MADDPTRADGAPNPPRSPRVVKVTTTMMVAGPTTVTADLLLCEDGDFHTVTVASPDGVTGVVLAGDLHDLTHVFRTALAVLPDETTQ